MQFNGHLLFPAALLLTAFSVMVCHAQPISMSGPPSFYNEIESDPDPETVLELLARLEQSFIRARENANTKRGMDLGLSRGYSGSMAGKHLMGLASANYAGGPGRRRRSVTMV